MSTTDERVVVAQPPTELAELRRNWGWFVLLGVALIIVGSFAMMLPWVASLATALVIGALLLVGGVVEIIGSFWSRGWSGFFLHVLSGILSLVVGVLFLRAPVDALLALTLLLACLFMVGGVFRIVAALSYRFDGWGWTLTSGIIDLVLGGMIWLEWPVSGLWVLGLFVGIGLVFRGFTWIALGMALRGQQPTMGERAVTVPVGGAKGHPA
jgi:uncharacterized membrane protein HdeD (DUF308 family)